VSCYGGQKKSSGPHLHIIPNVILSVYTYLDAFTLSFPTSFTGSMLSQRFEFEQLDWDHCLCAAGDALSSLSGPARAIVAPIQVLACVSMPLAPACLTTTQAGESSPEASCLECHFSRQHFLPLATEGDSIVPTFWGATQNVELLAKEVVAKLLFFAGASLQNAFLGTQAGMRSILADFVEDEVLSLASLCVLCHGRQLLRLWVMKGGEKLMVTASCPWSCLV